MDGSNRVWPFKKRSKESSRKTQDLSPHALAESAKHRDLYELLELFLVKRVETELTLEEKRAEVKLKSAEAEAQTKLKLAEIREQQRQLRASKQAERNRTMPRDSRGRVTSWRNVQAGNSSGCLACQDPGNPNLTVDIIRRHHAEGHDGGQRPIPSQSNGTAGN